MSESLHPEYDTYCVRCGKPLPSSEAYYSDDDPDHEESLCCNCYKHLELSKKLKIESEEL